MTVIYDQILGLLRSDDTPGGTIVNPVVTGTAAAIIALRDAGNLQPGGIYKVNNYPVHQTNGSAQPIYLTAATTNSFEPMAILIYRGCDYNGEKTGNLGLWNSGLTPSIGQFVAWSGFQWVNTSGSVGTSSNYNLSGADWTKITDTTTASYLNVVLEVSYDIDQNMVFYVLDDHGNQVDGVTYEYAPIGSDNFYDNLILGDNSYTGLLNLSGTFSNNEVIDSTVDSDFFTGTIQGVVVSGDSDLSIDKPLTSCSITNGKVTDSSRLVIQDTTTTNLQNFTISGDSLVTVQTNGGLAMTGSLIDGSTVTVAGVTGIAFTTALVSNSTFTFNAGSGSSTFRGTALNSVFTFATSNVVFTSSTMINCSINFSNASTLTFVRCLLELDSNSLSCAMVGTWTDQQANKNFSTFTDNVSAVTAVSGNTLTIPATAALLGNILLNGNPGGTVTLNTLANMPRWPVYFYNQTSAAQDIVFDNTTIGSIAANKIVADVTDPILSPNNADFIQIYKQPDYGYNQVINRKVWL